MFLKSEDRGIVNGVHLCRLDTVHNDVAAESVWCEGEEDA